MFVPYVMTSRNRVGNDEEYNQQTTEGIGEMSGAITIKGGEVCIRDADVGIRMKQTQCKFSHQKGTPICG